MDTRRNEALASIRTEWRDLPDRNHLFPEKEEEELCEEFMRQWLREGSNRSELEALLAGSFKGEESELIIF